MSKKVHCSPRGLIAIGVRRRYRAKNEPSDILTAIVIVSGFSVQCRRELCPTSSSVMV